MNQQLGYLCPNDVQPLQSPNGAALVGCTQDPIEQAYREQEQAFERLLERYREMFRIAEKRSHA